MPKGTLVQVDESRDNSGVALLWRHLFGIASYQVPAVGRFV